MLRLFLYFFLFSQLLPNKANAAEPSTETPPAEVLPGEEPVPDDEDEDDILDPELALSQLEIREKYGTSVAFGLGYTEAWQGVSLSGTHSRSRDFHYYSSFGVGVYQMVDSKDSKDYNIELKTKSLGIGGRYFFTDFTSVFLQLAGGIVFVDGEIRPSGSDENVEEATEEQIRSSFVANGPWLSQQIGWQYSWSPGWFLECALFGISKTWVTSSHYTNNSSQAKTDAKERIETPISWGVINIKFGKMF